MDDIHSCAPSGTPLPPANLEFEQYLIAALLKGATCPDFLGGQHFVDPIHSLIYSTVAHFRERRLTANLTTITAHFERSNELAEVGGVTYLTHLVHGARRPTLTPREYARGIHDLWVERLFIGRLMDLAVPPPTTAQETIQ